MENEHVLLFLVFLYLMQTLKMAHVGRMKTYRCLFVVVCPQTELDNVNGLLTEVEGKSIKASKDCSAVESQLQDVQVRRLYFT